MVLVVILSCLVSYFFGRADQDDESLTGLAMSFFIVAIIFGIFGAIKASDSRNTPKYIIKENVQLPDSSYGKIDSVYYKIEGTIYNQSQLKKD